MSDMNPIEREQKKKQLRGRVIDTATQDMFPRRGMSHGEKEEEVAERIEKIHMDYTSVLQYNDENSLSSVLTIAYLGAMRYYFKPIRELPLGKGFADFVFLPKHEYANAYPALLIELKWDHTAETAIGQIKERKYPSTLEAYSGQILLVGINYERKSKEHQCIIEKYQK